MVEERRMLPRERFSELRTSDDVQTQVRIRRELLQQMVGTLYPSIIRDEIADLLELERVIDARVFKIEVVGGG